MRWAMKTLRRSVWTAGSVAIFLVAMLLMFWTIDILPLVLFGGMIIVYASLSSQQNHKRKTVLHPPQPVENSQKGNIS
ncbi:MAG: hypothetical protein C7B44_07285 [Sulfobacillus thermosulfidooxidans]|nr:MAG: hypothetical protein C7B44_07285 [Sulfobacillus thermosulfidooxidans]